MKRSFDLSAAQLAAVSGLGGLIAASSFLVLDNPWIGPTHHTRHFSALFSLGLVMLVAGGVLALRSATNLESGIANERWPEAQIDSLRKLSRSRAATILTFALLIGFAALSLFTQRFSPIGWSLFLLSITLNALRTHIPPFTRRTEMVQPLPDQF
jgi:hypothetical protein